MTPCTPSVTVIGAALLDNNMACGSGALIECRRLCRSVLQLRIDCHEPDLSSISCSYLCHCKLRVCFVTIWMAIEERSLLWQTDFRQGSCAVLWGTNNVAANPLLHLQVGGNLRIGSVLVGLDGANLNLSMFYAVEVRTSAYLSLKWLNKVPELFGHLWIGSFSHRWT